MNEYELRSLIGSAKAGATTRREVMRRLAAAGLAAPLASQLLALCGIAAAQTAQPYAPTARGGGGHLKILMWQAPTLLNPHFASGLKDVEASRVFYEPLAAWDADGNLVPVLAAEVPSLANGGLAADGRSVVWTLKRDVTWHDGRPLTADDVVFNWEYARDPATASLTVGSYSDITVEKIDALSVRVRFERPTPFWADAFVGTRGMLIPKHLFAEYTGAKSRDAPANLKPVGTGPYKFVEFKPGDFVRAEINRAYHKPARPHFDTLEIKGGGDAVSAARAVMQTGEFDYAWNVLVEDDVLKRLEAGGKGRAVFTEGGNPEHIQLNMTDPWTEVDGERSSLKTTHPVFADPRVRRAFALLADRTSIQEHIFGRAAVATGNYLHNPERYRSKATTWEFNVEKAGELLESAGWKKGPDGVRIKDGRRLKILFQTSTNAPRQKAQQIYKQACQRAGIDVELRSITASVYFSADPGNPDTFSRFSADVQMYQSTMLQPDPGVFMGQFCSWEAATLQNKWQGRNKPRWRHSDYDAAYRESERELDPVRRAALLIRLNDILVGDHAIIPLVNRLRVSVLANSLVAPLSGWDNDFGLLSDWHRKA